jgi:predicted naringenin-chalcone synthase
MSWRIGDHGFEMTLAASVPDLIKANLRAWLAEWLRQQGLSLEEIGFWAVHPGGPRILTAVQESLGLPAEALAVSREVLDQQGNMSSPTVLFILQEHVRRSATGPGVMLGFGPGLMAEAALLR